MFLRRIPGSGIVLIAASLWHLPSQAENQVTQIPFSDTKAGTVGLGAGLRFGRSPYKYVESVSSLENENNADLVPLYLYEGKYLFFHGTRAGVHLLNNGLNDDLNTDIKLDLVAQYRFDRLETGASDFYNGVNERDQTLEGGLSLAYHPQSEKEWGKISFSALNDIQSRHNGHVLDLTYQYNIALGNFQFHPYVSLIYQSQDFVDYYFGVDADEARADLPEYQPGAATFGRVGINTTYTLFDDWFLFANLSFENVDEEIENSPLVDKDYLTTTYLGFSYQFGNVFEPRSSGFDLTNIKDWSWRVHAGYQAEATFHKVHRGDVSRSDDINTHLAGVTLGKLLSDGRIIDYWGKFSLNRRFEDGYQDNFWQYDIYAMAMGTGYSPWSEKELFRYGFGFGFSYAQKIPAIEQIKQQKKEGNNAHFLNYLEAQVDFPLRNMVNSQSLRNCYVGLTIIHRSGIFATADILGNVSGGSDILAGHLECKQ